jgi:RNA polymerase sigma-70 factor (ECF subfamily)
MNELETRSDAELLKLSLAGQESAFRLLYERLKRGIFRYAYYMTNSQTEAEEVTQEVFIALLKAGAYRKELGDVGGFAFGIARNLVRRLERREHVYRPLPANDALDNSFARLACSAEALPAQLIRSQIVKKVQTAVASLPDHYRQAVVLCDLCELSYSEAACRLGCAVGTVRSRLSRGHALLREKLKPLSKAEPAIGGTEGCLI